MSNLYKILTDGVILSLIASVWLMVALLVNPRIFLHDYPVKIQEAVPKKTNREKQLTYVFGVPLMLLLLLVPFFSTLSLKAYDKAQFWALWLNAAGVMWVFNIVDWLILDWLIFCTLTPRFVIIPGSEGMAEYKDYRFHFHGFLKGTVFSILGGLIIAGVVYLL
ncbi:MAG: hypothetical protein A2Y88_14340 [Chloroflexi bacterium RBG_13_48_10]|nr:MAG: hypothetical protein A2Y88_14340 [Chloroflexi bacterium RBG_13_48_10]